MAVLLGEAEYLTVNLVNAGDAAARLHSEVVVLAVDFTEAVLDNTVAVKEVVVCLGVLLGLQPVEVRVLACQTVAILPGEVIVLAVNLAETADFMPLIIKVVVLVVDQLPLVLDNAVGIQVIVESLGVLASFQAVDPAGQTVAILPGEVVVAAVNSVEAAQLVAILVEVVVLVVDQLPLVLDNTVGIQVIVESLGVLLALQAEDPAG